jgi:hypothetical protein
MRCYDGQRVPINTLLAKQFKLDILPGWNTRFGFQNDIYGTCHGRVVVTTEKCDLNHDLGMGRLDYTFPGERFRGKNVFRMHCHVIPDEQHQHFKLVEQR